MAYSIWLKLPRGLKVVREKEYGPSSLPFAPPRILKVFLCARLHGLCLPTLATNVVRIAASEKRNDASIVVVVIPDTSTTAVVLLWYAKAAVRGTGSEIQNRFAFRSRVCKNTRGVLGIIFKNRPPTHTLNGQRLATRPRPRVK